MLPASDARDPGTGRSGIPGRVSHIFGIYGKSAAVPERDTVCASSGWSDLARACHASRYPLRLKPARMRGGPLPGRAGSKRDPGRPDGAIASSAARGESARPGHGPTRASRGRSLPFLHRPADASPGAAVRGPRCLPPADSADRTGSPPRGSLKRAPRQSGADVSRLWNREDQAPDALTAPRAGRTADFSSAPRA